MKNRIVIAAAIALFAVGAATLAAPAAEKLKVGFIYLGPVGDFGWTYQHEVGRQGLVKALGDKIDTTYLENVNEGPDSERSIEQLARTGHKLIFTTSFGYMDPTIKVASRYPKVDFEHATGFKRAAERQHLFRPLLRRPLHPGPDRRQDVEDRRARLHRVVPDPGSDLRHQCDDARRADGQSEHQGQDHLGEHLVRSGQGSRCRQGARRPGRGRADATHQLARRHADRLAARHCSPSARTST